MPLAETRRVTRSKIRSPDSGSPSPEQPRAQRASFTSTQTAREEPASRTGCRRQERRRRAATNGSRTNARTANGSDLVCLPIRARYTCPVILLSPEDVPAFKGRGGFRPRTRRPATRSQTVTVTKCRLSDGRWCRRHASSNGDSAKVTQASGSNAATSQVRSHAYSAARPLW